MKRIFVGEMKREIKAKRDNHVAKLNLLS